MLVSHADKTVFGQGAGTGPQGGGTMVDLGPGDLGYGGSVNEPDTEQSGLHSGALGRRRSALGLVGAKRRALGADSGGASSGAMNTQEIGPALGPPEDDAPPTFVPADPAAMGIPAPPPPPETIRFCPFCSSANVVGRSDGAVSCGYCGASFAVVQRNAFPFMPGPEPGVDDQWPEDLDEDDEETADDDEENDESEDGEGEVQDDRDEWDEEDPSGLGGSNGDDDGSEVAGSDTVIPADVRHAVLAREYRTADGPLKGDLYLRRLALRHSVNRSETLLELRDAQ